MKSQPPRGPLRGGPSRKAQVPRKWWFRLAEASGSRVRRRRGGSSDFALLSMKRDGSRFCLVEQLLQFV